MARYIHSEAEIRQLVREEMEAAGVLTTLNRIDTRMTLLVGNADDPDVPVSLRTKGFAVETKELAAAAASQSSQTAATLSAYTQQTDRRFDELQSSHHKLRRTLVRWCSWVWRNADDDKVSWKRITTIMGAISIGVHGAFTWIPKLYHVIMNAMHH